MRYIFNYWYWKIQAICQVIVSDKYITVSGESRLSLNIRSNIADVRAVANELNRLADEREAGNKAVDQCKKILNL
jgi:hypothetical protein